MNFVLTGIQGSGKSTQGNLLSKELRIPYLSTGHIFREIAKEKTALGRFVKELITAGELVPDDKTIQVVRHYLSQPQYKRGYILDGFPRTVAQAKKFDKEVDKVVYLEIPDKEALWRLAYRDDVARDDNTIQALRKRIELFHTHTDPVIEYFDKKGKLIKIDGMLSIKEVNEEILKSLGKEMVNHHLHAWHQKEKAMIVCVGLPGAGKSEAAEYFVQKGLPMVSFGKVLNDYIDKNKLEQIEEVHMKIRTEWRQKHGMAAFAIMNEEKIAALIEKNHLIVLEGLRSWEEYQFLLKRFPKVRIYTIAIFADKDLRYKRSAERTYRNKFFGHDRDVNEIIGTNMAPTIAFADFIVTNNGSVEEFHEKLERIYNTIYFS